VAKRKALSECAEHPSVDANELLARAQAGDHAATAQLRQFMETHPQVWDAIGDLGHQALLAGIRVVTSGNSVLEEAVMRKLTDLRSELAGPTPTVLERLLVERVLIGWLHCHYADIVAARRTDVSPAQAEYYQRRQDHAQRRYLAAIRTLACVRRLPLPAIQVNIGAQQVNVAGAGDAT